MKRVAIWTVRSYIAIISPHTLPRCRFQPTCSRYALQAFQCYGLLRGGALTLRRILRCHPWGGSGYDPVP